MAHHTGNTNRLLVRDPFEFTAEVAHDVRQVVHIRRERMVRYVDPEQFLLPTQQLAAGDIDRRLGQLQPFFNTGRGAEQGELPHLAGAEMRSRDA